MRAEQAKAWADECEHEIMVATDPDRKQLLIRMRALWLDAPAGNSVWGAVAWSVGIIAVVAPLAVSRYRRAVTA